MSIIRRKSVIAAAVAVVPAAFLTLGGAQAQVVFEPAPAAVVAAPGVSLQIRLAPPPLPVYAQPPCPVPGYLWTPGYWAYGPAGYYWVPGTWVAPPSVGLLWTPGYWGFIGGLYRWHPGYWGPRVGFYGGVNYGFGYGGVGYAGGRWVGRSFAYNAAVTNVNRNVIHNTYREAVAPRAGAGRVSFNGGPGGIRATPSAQERLAARDHHVAPTAPQRQHAQQAGRNPRAMPGAAHAMPREAARNTPHQRPQAAPRPQASRQPAERQRFERPQQRAPQARPQPQQRAQPQQHAQQPRPQPQRQQHQQRQAERGAPEHGREERR